METKTNPVPYKPEDYPSIVPYLLVEGLTREIEFLQGAFGATEIRGTRTEEGVVSHIELRIGDAVLMLAEARGEWKANPTMLYVYVPDTDAAYHSALSVGGTSLMEPADQFYGDRNAGVLSPGGNSWWIATQIERLSPEELQRRESARQAATNDLNG